MSVRPYVHDGYAPLNHKSPLEGVAERRPGVQTWVPIDDQRRLAAYQVLAMIRDNVARYILPSSLGEAQIAKYREYGHASRLIAAAYAAVLGEEQTIHVPGAVELLDLAADTEPPPGAEQAQAALDYLRKWAEDELLWLEVLEAEQDAIGLGDAVYTLSWDDEKKRARIRAYDPGFFFPPVEERDSGDFPRKVHICWEQKNTAGNPELHRLTWWLGPILPALDVDNPSNFMQTDDGTLMLQQGDRYDGQGQIVRDYPWQSEPSAVTCYFQHGVWSLKNVKGDVFDLNEGKARWEQPMTDLRVDFIPVVHLPNTPARREFFGRSLITPLAQIFDDLSSTYTDLLESSALAGNATLVTKGGPGGVDAGPGALLELGENGDAHYLDVSKNLDALIKMVIHLLDVLAENSRISKATLGRTDGANTVSGLQLALSFSPTEALVRELRMVRTAKYQLLLKMVLRFAQSDQQLVAGETPPAEVLFGSFLPADRAQAVEQVTALLTGKAISQHTAAVILQEAGFPIDDAVEEVERITRENFDAAVTLVEATGNTGDAYRLLGLKPATDPSAAPPVSE